MNKLQVGIDNYGLYPLKLSPLQLLQWAKDNNAEGVAFSGLSPEELKNIDSVYLKDIAHFAEINNLYLEWGSAQHIPFNLSNWKKKDVFEINKKAAKDAEILGTRIVRSCSGGLMRWQPESPMTETLLLETAKALKAQKQMLLDHNVILAIETHFEFTTQELLKIFDMCDTEPGEYLGICLDTMNLLTMLENPVLAAERVLPWIVSTHIKDGALQLTSTGMKSYVTEIGKGVVQIEKIIKRLLSLSRNIHLSIEDHGGDFLLPIFDPIFISKFPDLTTSEFADLIELAQISEIKLKNGDCEILEREKWPKICEERMKRNIIALKKIRENNVKA